jgi:uncharacterized alpha-E superfamily protein
MSRYTERAENTARMLDVSYQMSLLPQSAPVAQMGWQGLLSICELLPLYKSKYKEVTAANVMRFMITDMRNPSSIVSCLWAARENARAVRGAITSEMWEVINATWLELNRQAQHMPAHKYPDFFDWVKDRSHLFRGVTLGTIQKDIALSFIKLGTFLERADNTARILDVKYHILLPSVHDVGGAADYYQWGSLLKSVSAFEAYRKIYRDVISPLRVAELLILRDDMPRSLHACMNEVEAALIDINGASGREARRRAGEQHAALHFGRIETVFRQGLHEYLIDFLAQTDRLGRDIRDAYLSRRDRFANPPGSRLTQTACAQS